MKKSAFAHRFPLRKVSVWLTTLLMGFLLTACAVAPPAEAPEPMMEEEATPDNVTVFGATLPDDALPYSQQVYRLPCSNTATQVTFDFAVSVYQRICTADQFNDALITLDKDFNVQPLAAESWEPSEDGLTWYIKIREGQMWNDGVPLTAHDYVATYRLSANPETGWDFSWFYGFLGPGGIKNWKSGDCRVSCRWKNWVSRPWMTTPWPSPRKISFLRCPVCSSSPGPSLRMP